MLDPRRLAVLREFAVRGTIAGAADALSFTPSAVSQQLAQLQREAGVKLFRKVGRRLELTDAGRTLVARADELLARIEEIDAELAAQAEEVRGTIRVGAFQTAASAIVIPALDRLAERHPRLRVELVEAEAASTAAMPSADAAPQSTLPAAAPAAAHVPARAPSASAVRRTTKVSGPGMTAATAATARKLMNVCMARILALR